MTAPLDETTWDELRQVAARYPQPRSGLLPMLHLVQSVQGRVTPEGIRACAEVLGLEPAEVHGVATFYTMFKRRPVGHHLVGVCTNTLCAVLGGDEIFATLQAHLGIGNDETTPEEQGRRSISLEHVECNAACDYAPVVMVDWEFFDQQTPESAVRLVEALRDGEPVVPTRGACLRSWRDTERVLAGFPDDRADEGPGAGEASLVGLRLATERGWAAPAAAGSTGGSTGGAGSSPASDSPSAVAADEQADTARAETEATIAEADDD